MPVIQTVQPANGRPLARYDFTPARAIEERLAHAVTAFEEWRVAPLATRTGLLDALAALLERDAVRLATLAACEMGKPIAQGVKEVQKSAGGCRHYATHAAEMLADELVKTEASKSYIAYRPLGPVFCIMPWNFPFWQVVRFAAPALAAGNVILLKHAENVAGTALALAALFDEAGFPPGVFQNLLIDHRGAEQLIMDERVRAVTLTGSEKAGAAVAATAGASLKKCVLELGGSDAYVVLADADVALAAKVCAEARLTNSGQSCVAAKRFIAVSEVHDAFRDAFVEELAKRKVGDPLRGESDVGPMAKAAGVEALERQVKKSVARGARLLLGTGVRRTEEGFWFDVTALEGVTPGMAAFDEEVFGPVAAIIRAKDEGDALRLTNMSRYGLGGAIFSRDTARAERLATDHLECGLAFVNGQVASDARLPFGGVKLSGYGRELGLAGLREFVNVKTVVIR